MKIVFINNKDSFVWNLVDYISYFEKDTLVLPNTVTLEELKEIKPDALVISPGPEILLTEGHRELSGNNQEMGRKFLFWGLSRAPGN